MNYWWHDLGTPFHYESWWLTYSFSRCPVCRAVGHDFRVSILAGDDSELRGRGKGCCQMGWCYQRRLLLSAELNGGALGTSLGQVWKEADHHDRSILHHVFLLGLGCLYESEDGHHRPCPPRRV